MSLPSPYPDLRPSELTWAPLIPSHWEVKRAKYLFNLERRSVRPQDDVVTAFRDGEVTLRSKRRTNGFTNSEKEVGYQGVRAGDLVIHAMDAFAGAVGVSDSDGKCTPVYSCCTPIGPVCTEFYGRMLRTMALTGFIESLSKGIRERSTDFRWREFAEQPLPVPPLAEQHLISRFVDREAGRIDSLIVKKGRFIELLREKRLALIARAVTKGLDPNAPMVSSGVKWLGAVPSKWKVTPLKYLCTVRTGNRDTAHAVSGGGYPFFVRSQTVEEIDSYSADCEAILTAGDGAGVGKIYHYFNGKFDFHQRVYMLSQFNGVRGRYLFYYLSALFAAVALDGGAKSTVDSLRMPVFMGFAVAYPPLSEQDIILEYVDRQVQRIDDIVIKTERSIELLKEHRSALITAAVTGKIDVRGRAGERMEDAA
ncbi:restriction endonuclease subunit S [Methylobacterium sp. B4]|uniref:restriction endonuclease subunit S n=1 Tax=Methylobacterium sp. B4 TaxID=1938755 RepID=UPI000D775928|nr:restriction endonuclease subunit S [Methylobacterium sp. B4]PXW57735.1 type I restriction enzyme S subunit [Methylobacterium sp. B4]